jgi:DNA gyrase subunit A
MGFDPSKQHRKCAGIIGEVLKSYHPHGDTSVYDALVRMAQDFTLRYPLVDGHGNFGSIDPDPPAAYRYTEARLARTALDVLADIDKETVPFVQNFDNQGTEPSVLPGRLPQLLVNGSSGIAVGMATNIPPHNLGEISDAIAALVDDPELSDDDLCNIVTGPDFPTGGTILGQEAIREAYKTGRGSITIRGKAEIIEERGKHKILITEIPYQVYKSRILESIAEAYAEKRIAGIARMDDESNRKGMRVVIELQRDAESRSQSALQAHAAAGHLRVQHARPGARRETAFRRVRADRAASALAQAAARAFHRASQGRHHAAHALRFAQGRGACAPARRLPHRTR